MYYDYVDFDITRGTEPLNILEDYTEYYVRPDLFRNYSDGRDIQRVYFKHREDGDNIRSRIETYNRR